MEKQKNSGTRFGNRGEYLVLLQFLLAGMFVLTPPWPDLRGSGPFLATAPARWLVLGLCSIAAAVFLFGGILSIRRYLTPLPYPVDENRLVRSGVYKLVRHPIYTSMLLAAFGLTVFSASLAHLALSVVIFMFFDSKASKEEAWLTERHPDYPGYAERTGKFFPRLPRKSS
jgi:protein-S-isoprenylcysteine O-methyltransferase Ste14